MLELLERVLEERKDFGGHAAALERLAAATRDRAALVQIHLAAARLKLVRLGDAPGALAALARALELDPACEPAALQSFEQLADAGRFAEALAVLERHLEATPERPGHAPLRVRAAELARSRLGDPGAGAAPPRGGAAGRSRQRPGGRGAGPAPRRARRVVPGWRRCWRCGWPPSPTPPSGSGCRSGWPPSSWSSWSGPATPSGRCRGRWRSTRAAPRCAPRWRRRPGGRGLVPELCRALRSAAQAVAGDPAARRALLRRAAELLDRELGQPEAAAEAWRELAAADPADREAAGGAGRLRGPGPPAAPRSWPGWRRHTPRPPGPARQETGSALARALSGAGRGAAAGGDLARAAGGLGRRPGGALGAPRRAGGDAGGGGGRGADAGAGPAGRAGPGAAERAELELERAAVLVEPLGRHGEAAGVVTALLSAGGATTSQQQQAVALLERLLARGVDPLRIARVLAPVHAARGEPAKQVAMLELVARRLPADADPRERARHLLDASMIRSERLGDARGALTDAAEALRAAPEPRRGPQALRAAGPPGRGAGRALRAAGRGGGAAGGHAGGGGRGCAAGPRRSPRRSWAPRTPPPSSCAAAWCSAPVIPSCWPG